MKTTTPGDMTPSESAIYEQDGCYASAMGWAIKYANERDEVARLKVEIDTLTDRQICRCEHPGPHSHPGSSGKFCAVCGWDISPNAPLNPALEQ